MTVKTLQKNVLSKFAANFFGQIAIIVMTVDNVVSQSTCFCEAFDIKSIQCIVFHNYKSFIVCQHFIVYLSHFTIMCLIIIYLEATQIYFVDLIALHLAAWWFVVNKSW